MERLSMCSQQGRRNMCNGEMPVSEGQQRMRSWNMCEMQSQVCHSSDCRSYRLTIRFAIEVMTNCFLPQRLFISVIDVSADICQNASLQQGRRKVSSGKERLLSLMNIFIPGSCSQGQSMGIRHVFDWRCQSRWFTLRCAQNSITAEP